MSSYFKVVPEVSAPSAAASPDKFDGGVWQADILARQRPDGLRGNRFSYAPGGRSHWHVHTGEQALVVVSGRGLIQWEGLAEPIVLGPGDWVHVEPGVPHWHGATDDSTFVHLAVTATGETEWGDPVT
ncbi:cupin domain-containing protein [Actinoplanes sp. L3-i22]|uniref:cupin domain-containing protein n=1 Tax=Actinoplanes sp. L3-i22 TaxID=2836373 RepID=UPI001C78A92E|nr:cupin domain-containing protein [Actinoplanes sp. L3-i22]BCY08352.1 cupin [Actinoplanes sp. L3-i22]